MKERNLGQINADTRKKKEGQAPRLPNPNDEKKPPRNIIMLERFDLMKRQTNQNG